ncbi:MAG TPA: FkbM family methyltransferase [Rhodothermales bacterium]|nr:FkbM family methyltransferase [Rhodothermales bacterium]
MANTSKQAQPQDYAQNIEFALLDILGDALQGKTFVDIGAEKGSFARFFMEKGLQGVLFEPFPRHHATLHTLTEATASQFYPYAIDHQDQAGILYLSLDEHGMAHDYYHSLVPLPDDPRVQHQESMPVVCRSLESLAEEGVLEPHIGVLKIDTEGNDLHVLRGMGRVRAEVLICEFFTEGVYAGWEEAHPEGLIAEAQQLGYQHYLGIQRDRGKIIVSWQPTHIPSGQWGNLIFMEDAIYKQCREALDQMMTSLDSTTRSADERSSTLQDWLARQIEQHGSSVETTWLIDVGAYQGDFTRSMLGALPFARALLFEPHPDNVAGLESMVASEDRITLVPRALGNAMGEVHFHATQDRATGSVLAYAPAALTLREIPASFPVQQTTLDTYLEQQEAPIRVGLLKIDTQGNDLNVLKGAERTLQHSRPWVVVELIFGPLYEGQARPDAVFTWLYEHGYHLAAFFNAHEADAGWLAFADAVFVPDEVDRDYRAPYHAKTEGGGLQVQIEALQTVCEERLALINHLHEEAARRLDIIQQLEKELRRSDTE